MEAETKQTVQLWYQPLLHKTTNNNLITSEEVNLRRALNKCSISEIEIIKHKKAAPRQECQRFRSVIRLRKVILSKRNLIFVIKSAYSYSPQHFISTYKNNTLSVVHSLFKINYNLNGRDQRKLKELKFTAIIGSA